MTSTQELADLDQALNEAQQEIARLREKLDHKDGIDMSKLAHSNQETMDKIERDLRARDNRGEPDEPTDKKSWRCFHCDKVFTNPIDAKQHFGAEKCKDADWSLNVRLRVENDELKKRLKELNDPSANKSER